MPDTINTVDYYPDTVPVVFTSSDYYVPYMSVTMQSIMENADKNKKYGFFILHQSISPESMKLLNVQVNCFSNFSIRYIDVTDYFKDFNPDISDSFLHLTKEVYFRLLVPYIFDRYDKVVYLDTDMICFIDISKLYDFELHDNMLAASRGVMDIASYHKYGRNFETKDIITFDGLAALKNPDNYFNSGMLVFNIKEWNISLDELFEFTISRNWRVLDQDLLNVLCEGKVLLLPLEYNFVDFTQNDDSHWCLSYLPDYIKKEYIDAQKSPQIIHFQAFYKKPWNTNRYNVYFEYFWKYATRTEYLTIIIDRMRKNNYIGTLGLREGVIYNIKNREGLGLRFIFQCFKAWLFRVGVTDK
ncbi:glycosyl transferase family 8 [Spirochaetia bacterium]|nr:glycosyl transferase family 8 [Spirochaetia bacterium]